MALNHRHALVCVAFTLVTACSSGTSGTSTTTGGTGSTTSGSSGDAGKYTIVPIDPAASEKTEFAMAISSDDRIGVVYFREDAGMYAEQQNVSVLYAEVGHDRLTATELVNVVNLTAGAAIAFQSGGQPAIAFLGGGDYNGEAPDHDAGAMGSLYWLQSQAEIDYRLGTNSWSYDVCMASSTGGDCQLTGPTAGCAAATQGQNNGFNWTIDLPSGSTTVDQPAEQLYDNPFGMVVGLWPSLVFDGGAAVLAFRDVHEGQFPTQDWGASAAKICIGGPSGTNFSWSAPLTIDVAGDNKTNGFGVHNQLVFGPQGILALIGDTDPTGQGELTSGAGPIVFTKQTGLNTQSNADWTPPFDPFNTSGMVAKQINDPGTGPRMVYDPTFGYAAVAVDLQPTGDPSTPFLYFTSSPSDGSASSWITPEMVYASGSGGFFPQIAVDPLNRVPVVSYTICSQSSGRQPDTNSCSEGEDELDTSVLTGSGWTSTTELPGNFWTPKFGFLSTGKKVFVYADLDHGGLYAAIEN